MGLIEMAISLFLASNIQSNISPGFRLNWRTTLIGTVVLSDSFPGTARVSVVISPIMIILICEYINLVIGLS